MVDSLQCLVCGPGGLLGELDLRSTELISQKSALSPGRVFGRWLFRSRGSLRYPLSGVTTLELYYQHLYGNCWATE